MANGGTHRKVGELAGASWALYRGRDEGWPQLIVEGLGGFVGGRFGGALPDVLEPAWNPRHRSSAHSLTMLYHLLDSIRRCVGNVQEWLRRLARMWKARVGAAESGFDAFLAVMKAFALRFASGLVVGIHAGYLSHLALDALTPSRLPLA